MLSLYIAEVSTKDQDGNPTQLKGMAIGFEQNLIGVQPLYATIVSAIDGIRNIRSKDDMTSVFYSLLLEISTETDQGNKNMVSPLTLRFTKEDKLWKFDGKVPR